MSLPKLCDQYLAARTARLELQHQCDKLHETEKELKAQIIAGLLATDATAAGGEHCQVTLVTKDEPSVTDWNTVLNYVEDTNSRDLLYRRVNPKAVRERWEAGEEIPGITKYPVSNISVHEVK